MFRVRIYVLAMVTRILLLIQLLMVLSLLAKYCVDVREYPRRWPDGPCAGDVHHGKLHVSDDLLSPPSAAALLAAGRHRGLCRQLMVDVLDRRFHQQGTTRLNDRLLGVVRRA